MRVALGLLVAAPVAQRVETSTSVEDLVITGSRIPESAFDAAVATEVIDRATIAVSGAESLAELLEEYSGVQVDRSFRGSTLEIRGLDSEHVLVLVDGQRSVGTIDGSFDLARFPVERIERVEIVKGAVSASYGADALGGVINIVTRRARAGLEASVRARYGSLDNVDLAGTAGTAAGPANLRVSTAFHRVSAYDLSPEDPATSGSAFTGFQVDARGEFDVSPRTTWIARAEYSFRETAGVDTGPVAVLDRKNNLHTFGLTAGPDVRFDDGSRLRLTAYGAFHRDQFLLDQRGAAALDATQDTRELLGQLTGQYDIPLGADHLLSVGIEGLYQLLRSERLRTGDGDRGRVAAFLQDRWSVLESGRIVIVPGVRVDVDTRFGTQPTPKLSVRLRPFDALVVRANVGRGFRSPTFKEQLLFFENPTAGYVVIGNPDVLPETSWSYVVGVETRVGTFFRFTLDAFRNDVDNLITAVPIGREGAGGPVRFSYVNVAAARTQGLEAVARLRPLSWLGLDLGYTLLDARDLEAARRLYGRATHRVVFRLSAAHPASGLNATLRGAFVGARPFFIDGEGVVEAEPYATLDGRLEKTLATDHVSAFIGADNLLNAGDARFLAIPPRSFYGGVRGHY